MSHDKRAPLSSAAPSSDIGLTGLLLGAGASFDVGMPLASELTKELKNWLTPSKLLWLNDCWLQQGRGYSNTTINDLARILAFENMNYEHIAGYLEVQKERQQLRSNEYHGLLAFLSEMIYVLLMERHVLNVDRIERNIRCLDGIKAFVENNRPLWILSLNHDLVVECFSTKEGIPLKCGFSEETIQLPHRNRNGIKTGETIAHVTRREQLAKNTLDFFQKGEEGINLLKIHGSLDEFAFNDGQDLLKIIPNDNTVSGVIAELQRVNNEVKFVDPRWPGGIVKATNEIVYADIVGKPQFLRRTPLLGAFKFQIQANQTVPKELQGFFGQTLNYLTSLVSIGYSFGDTHVNQAVRDWLEGNDTRHLTIVDPAVEFVPTTFGHLYPQIELIKSRATDFLDNKAGISRTRQEIVERELQYLLRGKTGEEADALRKQYLDQIIANLIDKTVEWIATLPFRNGDIDLEELGLTQDEFIDMFMAKVATLWPENSLEEFLRHATSKA